MGARIKKHIIIQYRIILYIMSLKCIAQSKVEDERRTQQLITHILCVCMCMCMLAGRALVHFMVVTEQAKCQ
jgi:hypothetical protein